MKGKVKKRFNDVSKKLCASQSRLMLRSDKSASGTIRNCHHSRTVTVSRAVGTEDHLPRSDIENKSSSPQ